MKKLSGPLSRRYGTALYESAIETLEKSGVVAFEQFSEKVRSINSFFDKEMILALQSPILTIQEKFLILDDLFFAMFKEKDSTSEQLLTFLKLIVENGRISAINPILHFFLKKADEKLGLIRVSITSAAAMTAQDKAVFEEALSKATQKKMICHYEEDASLLAGFVVKIGNTNIDATLKSRLSSLKESLS